MFLWLLVVFIFVAMCGLLLMIEGGVDWAKIFIGAYIVSCFVLALFLVSNHADVTE